MIDAGPRRGIRRAAVGVLLAVAMGGFAIRLLADAVREDGGPLPIVVAAALLFAAVCRFNRCGSQWIECANAESKKP